jgi:hypothetical protein
LIVTRSAARCGMAFGVNLSKKYKLRGQCTYVIIFARANLHSEVSSINLNPVLLLENCWYGK